jgi:hypothetical protein
MWCVEFHFRGWSLAGIVSDNRLDYWNSFPGTDKGLIAFLFGPVLRPLSLCPMDMGGKARLGRDADHSPPSRAKVRMNRSSITSPPSCLHGGWVDSFTFLLSFLQPLIW